MTIKQIKTPDNVSHDIGAKYDANGNIIVSTYETKTDATTKLSNYYTKSQIDSYELITTADIDAICGTTIQVANNSEVTF